MPPRHCVSALMLLAAWLAAPGHLHAQEADLDAEVADEADPSGLYFWEDHRLFEPVLADVNAPVHYMGVYGGPAVRFTRPSERAAGARRALADRHLFWNVGFGEEFVLLGRDDPAEPGSVSRPTGQALFVDGDVHMLLDFFSHSGAVLTTDFRLGGGVMGRGLPGVAASGLERFSWKFKFLHESTHIGDEYLGNAYAEHQAGNAEYADFRRVNVSFEALELFLSWDDVMPGTGGRLSWRAYGGYRFLLRGPWLTHPGELASEIAAPPASSRHEGQLGVEGSWRLRYGGRGWPRALVMGTDVFLRRQYDYTGQRQGLRAASVNGLLGFEWGAAHKGQTRLRAMLNAYHGINPRGQFRDEPLAYLGLMTQFDY